MSTKAPKKPASKNAALAKGAEAIRKAAAKAPAKKPASKKNGDANGVIVVVPPAIAKHIVVTVESTEEIQSLLKKHVVFGEASLRIKDETELAEFLPIYDFVVEEGKKAKDKSDKWQFVEGDLFNEGRRLYGSQFAVLMATNGRKVSTLKKLGSIADNIDTALRFPALPWSVTAEVAKVPNESDKRAILEKANERAEKGDAPTVKEIRAEADKHKPRKKKGSGKKKPAEVKYEMTPDESAMYDEFSTKAEDLRSYIVANKKELRALFPKLTGNDKKAMIETLELAAELYTLLV